MCLGRKIDGGDWRGGGPGLNDDFRGIVCGISGDGLRKPSTSYRDLRKIFEPTTQVRGEKPPV